MNERIADSVKIVDSDKTRAFVRSVFIKTGLNPEHAEVVSANLCQAELRGVYSHGISKVNSYVRSIEDGTYNRMPEIAVLKESGSTVLIDGDYAMGAVSGSIAMETCMNKAEQTGFACAAVRNGRHFGMAAFYAMMALSRGMIGIALCNSGKIMSSYGGTNRVLGTNPICIAVPSGKSFPFVFDAATSEAAFNKIVVADLENRDISEGWALDEEGRATTSAKKAVKGMVLPFGGYKGSGLAIMVNVLSGILGNAVGDALYEQEENRNGDSGGVGFFFSALDISRFQPLEAFTGQVDAFIDELKAARRRTADEEIYVPGELEYLRQQKHLSQGIAIGLGVYRELREVGARLGVPFDIVHKGGADEV